MSNRNGDEHTRPKSFSMIPKATQEWMERRSLAFAEATSRPAGRPKDGVTYAARERDQR